MNAARVQKWTLFETQFESHKTYQDPIRDVTLEVRLTDPNGGARHVEAFWDGGKTWRVRFAPDVVGQWSYATTCSDAGNIGLHHQIGTFECVAYTGDNPCYQHGRVKLSDSRRYLVSDDGSPFFWLACTAWNGALKSDAASWETYLQNRLERGFSVIQFVMTQWRAAKADREGQLAFTGPNERIEINPAFFQRMDGKYEAVNRHGLVASPVMLWAIRGDDNPGYFLPESEAILLTRYMVARYGAYHVIWILGGDGDYRGENTERWKRIGQAIFGDHHDRLATMHPGGLQWVGEEFRNEAWFSFISFQSGHGDNDNNLKWLTTGPPSRDWDKSPVLPVINQEPNYEAHVSYHSRNVISPFMVRRAAYWSLLVSPTAGVTYGHHGIWPWPEQREVPLGHASTGESGPWHEAIQAEGAMYMKVLREFFDGIAWHRLRPAQDVLDAQPGEETPAKFIAAAMTDAKDLAVIYTPEAGEIRLKTAQLASPMKAAWVKPDTGKRSEAGVIGSAPVQAFQTPGDGDWLLVLGKDGGGR